MIGLPTASDVRMRQQARDIYNSLVRCGFPGLISNPVVQGDEQIGETLSQYFQPTPRREDLIEWLIMQLYPLYSPDAPKGEKRANKLKRMLSCLWKLGVMPYSKHTKNMDYEKYMLGLIGLENAIQLVFNLCTLLIQSKKMTKMRRDGQFASFLEDIYKNYDALINVEYDPYKISFPPAFVDLPQQQFEEKYGLFLQKIKKLKEKETINEQSKDIQAKFEHIFKQFESKKSIFLEVYQKLSQKIRRTIEDHQSMVISWKEDLNQAYKGRTISVSSQLPSLYRQYKERVKIRPLGSSEMAAIGEEVRRLISSLNSSVEL